jgi:hypothetical protein
MAGRPGPRRNKTTEGFSSLRKASRAPKSVSAEIMIRSCWVARAKTSGSVAFHLS